MQPSFACLIEPNTDISIHQLGTLITKFSGSQFRGRGRNVVKRTLNQTARRAFQSTYLIWHRIFI